MAEDLPFIDELDAVIAAPKEAVFMAVARRVGRSFEGASGRMFTRLLGCAHRGNDFTVPPLAGQEVNGFRVARVQAPGELVLEGRHRFASYRLSFFIDALEEGRTRLRARTDALFPGLPGLLYRALVIGSGGHGFIVRQMLRLVAAQAIAPRESRS